MWDDLLPALQNHTCIAIDLHGHGDSFYDDSLTPSIELMAKQVKAVLESLSIGPYIVVGHSLGGYVANELLKTDPAVEHIVLFHSHPWADSESKKKDRDRVIELVKTKARSFIREAIPNLFAQPEKHPEAIETYCAMAEEMPPAAIGWSAAAMRDRSDYASLLQEKAGQVTIVQGQLDPIIPNLKLHAFAKEAGINWHEIAGCGHMSQAEATEEAMEILKVIMNEQ